MPHKEAAGPTKKRKRDEKGTVKRRVARKKDDSDSDEEDAQDRVLELESEAAGTGNYAPAIDEALRVLSSSIEDAEPHMMVAVALTRMFYKLLVGDSLFYAKGTSEADRSKIQQLQTKYRRYTELLCLMLGSADAKIQSTALALLTRMIKAEGASRNARNTTSRQHFDTFGALVRALTQQEAASVARTEFVETYVEEYDDMRYNTLATIAKALTSNDTGKVDNKQINSALELLLQIEGIPSSKDQLEDWYLPPPTEKSSPLLSLKEHQKVAQQAWSAIFSSALDKDQRKRILDVFTSRIVPWFTRPEQLMDFLTDSYDQGGATSLLALSGVYHLVRERNLDYPQFYTKLYSLLDDTVLHSKHRARFFRLLETFLSSTHLPSALVASFIKRLARLALHAPPGAIVMVVPFAYNMLVKHPQCTFMLHRNSPITIEAETGLDDPFDPVQPDPSLTRALDSSLWELETLRQHYHPNVATLARIVGEQFTKQEYSLEDFLDHSYNGLVDAELGKELKKAPVVEFEIPKRILTNAEGGLDARGLLLEMALMTPIS